MYLDDWLRYSPSKKWISNDVMVALRVLADIGFRANLKESALTSMQKLPWLGIEWDTIDGSLSMASANTLRTLRSNWRAYFSNTFFRIQ